LLCRFVNSDGEGFGLLPDEEVAVGASHRLKVSKLQGFRVSKFTDVSRAQHLGNLETLKP
jgi:hypothetical protein